MANEYFTPSGYPATGAAGSSANMRSELTAVQTAFDKLPALATNANKVVVVNPSATGQTVAPVTVSATGAVAGISTLATTGNTTVGGSVGVGTASPAYTVDAVFTGNSRGGYNVTQSGAGASAQAGYRAINVNATGLYAGVNGANYTGGFGTANEAVLHSIGNVALVLGTNSLERMRIDTAGGIFAGVSDGYPGYASRLSLGYDGGASRYGIALKPASDSTTAIALLNAAGASVGSITQTASTTSYNTTSDRRLKTAIVDAPAAGADIDAIQVRSYDWLSDGTHQTYGFIAQELAEVAPYAVHQPADPEQMMSVDYSKLVPLLVKEVQSLRARITALEDRP